VPSIARNGIISSCSGSPNSFFGRLPGLGADCPGPSYLPLSLATRSTSSGSTSHPW
jgi:hypothetical protein